MADGVRGRGRGLALIQALRKVQTPDSGAGTASPSPETVLSGSSESSPVPSVASSMIDTYSDISSSSGGGRGRLLAMMMAKKQDRPATQFCPASDMSPGPSTLSAGRGIKLMQSLKAAKAAGTSLSNGAKSQISEVTEINSAMSGITISPPKPPPGTKGSDRQIVREIKDTPPVVMKGSSGTPVEVTANFIYLNFKENNVYEYEVIYEPEQDFKYMRFKLLNEHEHYFKPKTFDGTTLYVPHQLPDEALELYSTRPTDDVKVKITIKFRRTRRLSELIHIYNVLFKCIMKDLQLVQFGRQYFNEHASVQIPQHKLEIWPGYVTAVDEYEGGLMLTLDSTHRVLRNQSVLTLIKEIVQTDGTNWKRKLTDVLVGCSVMTTYNKKLFRVDSIDDKMSPRSTFEKKIANDEVIQISYIDYYKKNYGIDIMDWDQPMLISRDTKRMSGTKEPTDFMICLVPELCTMTGLSDDQRSNFRLMKDVATYTRITPNQRHAAFKKYIEAVMKNETARSRLSGWGLSIAPETINITARTLAPEALYFGKGVKVPGKANAEWNSESTRNSVMMAVDIRKWALLFTDRDKQVATEFVETIKRTCGPMGINVSPPEFVRLPNDRTDTYVMALKKLITSELQLVVAICPTARDDRYAAIKKICCADNPIPSQVINARTLMNSNRVRAVTQKILLQLNCKLGGTLWAIDMPVKKAMVVGIDSYHDPTRKSRSVCTFVASYNDTMTQWYSRAVFQERGQEIVDSLKDSFVSAMTQYLRVNGVLPDRIIIYRDGVGDGQLQLLRDYEIPQMSMYFRAMSEAYQPMLTYVVVQKRINTRIFMKVNSGFDNPHPGTVVDHAITRRDWYDFLIASQKVNQGTVTPTHYVVVYDTNKFSPDQCQRLTYKMCHLYYNWPGTVRVPAPCQYAHKLAYLVGQNIHAQPSSALADKLYFL